ncbi:unnamed protein product [Pleuronectes platessa]|uniref:Uncharacterized protein n=1 Tax=Pleuronectes platessa TaxID=8262 RepID=A0A9N7YYD1_PLEPL|nr:unnamed protein product [Pleuronectes platessa]
MLSIDADFEASSVDNPTSSFEIFFFCVGRLNQLTETFSDFAASVVECHRMTSRYCDGRPFVLHPLSHWRIRLTRCVHLQKHYGQCRSEQPLKCLGLTCEFQAFNLMNPRVLGNGSSLTASVRADGVQQV